MSNYSYKGIEYLRRKLAQKRTRVQLRYNFYEMKNRERDFDISTPPTLRDFRPVLGWCAKAVDSLADRLVFREFTNDVFGLNEIFQMNNPDVLIPSAIQGALISSCDFIYISQDEEDFPRLQVISGDRATGVLDPITGLLNEGYAVLEEESVGEIEGIPLPKLEAHFTAEYTQYIRRGNRKETVETVLHKAGHPLLVPIINAPSAKRPFGHSRISRACMSIVGSALRTMKRSEISAEFYSFPQRWITGVDNDSEQLEKWRASMSSMLEFGINDDGTNHVQLGQFAQQSMEPHVSQLRMFASLFAGETGLTLDDLGFPTENPASAEAIRASHEGLRLAARHAQRTFGSGFLNVGFLAACLRDNFPYRRRQLYLEKPSWEPIFEPDAAMLSGIGDAVMKIQQAFPDYFTEDKLKDLTGI